MTAMFESRHIIGMRVDATSYSDVVVRVIEWSREARSRMVCAANVHMAMEAHDDKAFASLVNASDIVTPDGVPLVWTLRLLGAGAAIRVYGPDLTLRILERAAATGVPVGFYGSSSPVLAMCVERVRSRYPGIQVAYVCAPPFRSLSAGEDAAVVDAMNASGARIFFIGLGCPKQERWMHSHMGHVQGVMLGVGAAFDFIAGTTPQAPRWMMRCGLEWLFRLYAEPKRLWRRYLHHNPRFLMLLLRQLARLRWSRSYA